MPQSQASGLPKRAPPVPVTYNLTPRRYTKSYLSCNAPDPPPPRGSREQRSRACAVGNLKCLPTHQSHVSTTKYFNNTARDHMTKHRGGVVTSVTPVDQNEMMGGDVTVTTGVIMHL